MSINKGAHFDKDFKDDTPMFEKMMVTSVTDELLFPCIVYSMLVSWQKYKSDMCRLEDGKSTPDILDILSNSL